MKKEIRIASCAEEGKKHYSVKQFGAENAAKVHSFHKTLPGYGVTPLVELDTLAESLGVNKIAVKDESFRFSLNAFKGLGGSYAVGRYIADKLGIAFEDLTYDAIKGDDIREALGNPTFVTATDGNHGRGIAWTASMLGFNSVVYMPKGSAVERLNHIKALGAEASITDMNYDDTVRFAYAQAEENGWVIIQDTAWEGYETIPGWIMEGYTTIGHEVVNQLKDNTPTHIFLQAGVGALAGAMTGFFRDHYNGAERPLITIVEPDKADCIFRTAEADDGQMHNVTDDMDTIMAGLACGEPCTTGWNILRAHADNFLSIPDYVAAKGMRILGNPLSDDQKVISGESGAVTLGVVAEIMMTPEYASLREQLKLNKNSRILCISTEGDTDRENYRKIVWDGFFPSFKEACD